MNSFMCMEWIRKHGCKQHDYTTNKHVVDWVVNVALELNSSDADIELCKMAKKEAKRQLKLDN